MCDSKVNSLRLKFERGSAEPSDLDIFTFMKEKMKIPCESLMCMYKEKSTTSVIIKFKTEEGLKSTLDRLPETMEFSSDKYQRCDVQLSAANAVIRYVRLFNLPPEVEDQEIWNVMAKFGKIQRMVRERYGVETGYPIWTSVRGVYIEVKDSEEIPATIHVRNMRARVYYEGLVNKCFQCGSVDHLKANCPHRRTVNDRLNTEQSSSYSGVLKGAWVKPITVETSSEDKTENVMTNLNNLFPTIYPRNRSQIEGKSANTEEEKGTLTVGEMLDLGAEQEEQAVMGNNDHQTDAKERRETSLKRDRVIDSRSSGDDSGDGIFSEAGSGQGSGMVKRTSTILKAQRVITRSRSKLPRTNGKKKGGKKSPNGPEIREKVAEEIINIVDDLDL